MSTNFVIPPVALVPAYGGYIKNGQIVGYGTMRDNVNKINQTGYFSNGLLQVSPIMSTYIEWTKAPETIVMIIGNFISGKANGNNIIHYISTGSVYCDKNNNDSSVLARCRYVRVNKILKNCSNGNVSSSTSIGVVTLKMNWINNNLLNAFDIGDIDITSSDYEIDDAVRVDSNNLPESNKSSLILSIYN